MNITSNDLSTKELLNLLNESAISIIVEENDRFKAANHYFYELSGFSLEELRGKPLSTIFEQQKYSLIKESKKKILYNISKAQTIRSEDKQLSVIIKSRDGREIGMIMIIVLLSAEPAVKWGYKLIELSIFHAEANRIEKMEKLKSYLLNISQSLIRLKDIKNFYSLVLEAAGTSISQGEYCTILKLEEGNTLVPVAVRGYDWDVMSEFRLPLEKSFSWLKLGTLLDRTIIIDDIDELCRDIPNLVEVEGYSIKSSLQTPIYLNNEFYGLLTMDSSRKNVFTEDDFNTIEYLRAQIQIALENQLLYNKMQHQASHDELTDVASRGAFEEQVINFLRTKHDYESCCIIMLDLNDLKIVNDIWGHSSGDKLILEFIRVMQKHLRGSDLLARLGGDEFAICFFSSQSAQFIERIEEIQQYFIDNPLDFSGRMVSCYFSYGISYCPDDGDSYAVLLNTADSRMYKMKAALKSHKHRNDLHEYRQ